MKSVRSGIDTQAMASAVSKPGIDPRSWIHLAVVGKDQGFDPDNGVFVDVILQPTGEEETAFLGSEWSGDNAAGYFPVSEGDIVLCAVVQGDAANGVVIIKKLWSPNEKPPPELEDEDVPGEPTRNAVIRVQDGQKLRVIARAGASVLFEVDGGGNFDIVSSGTINVQSPDVRLGVEAERRAIARVADTVLTQLRLGVQVAPPPATPLPVIAYPAAAPILVTGSIETGSASAKAGA
jgi:hypothetical protein